jgi:hypothetical protein
VALMSVLCRHVSRLAVEGREVKVQRVITALDAG